MYKIITTANGKTFDSNNFDSLWAANLVAISYVRNYEEVTKADIIDRTTGEILKSYIK